MIFFHISQLLIIFQKIYEKKHIYFFKKSELLFGKNEVFLVSLMKYIHENFRTIICKITHKTCLL
jgi:hypothetical protein